MNSTDRTLRDIAQLASDRLGGIRGRALDREAKRRGLTLSYTTVDKILAGTYTSRPTRPTLEALSELSGVSREKVFAAAGVALPQKPLAEQLPSEVDSLTPDQRRVVIDLARVFVKQNQREQALLRQAADRGNHDDQEQSEANPSGERTVGAARDGGGVVSGQKTGFSFAPIVQWQSSDRSPSVTDRRSTMHEVREATHVRPEDDEVPPIEQLAAHPNFKTDRERFDEAHGEAGEESQLGPDEG